MYSVLRHGLPRRYALSNDEVGAAKGWCAGQESNLHALRRLDLNQVRLPIPPPAQKNERAIKQTGPQLLSPILTRLARLAPDAKPCRVHGRQGQQREHGGDDQTTHNGHGHRPPEHRAR